MSTDGHAGLAKASTTVSEVQLEDSKAVSAEATIDGLGEFYLAISGTCSYIIDLEDTVNAAIQPVLAAKRLYETNSNAIHEATKVLGTLGSTGRAVDDWVGVVDKVIGGLDELSKSTAFPFVGGKPNMLCPGHHVNIITL
jgi:hypothetical protein